MDTRIQIDFNGKNLSAYGRNETLKQIGIEAISAPEKSYFFQFAHGAFPPVASWKFRAMLKPLKP